MKLDELGGAYVSRNNNHHHDDHDDGNFLLATSSHQQQQQQRLKQLQQKQQQFYSENLATCRGGVNQQQQAATSAVVNPNLYSYIPRKTPPTASVATQLLYHSFSVTDSNKQPPTIIPQSYTRCFPYSTMNRQLDDDEQVLIKINPLAASTTATTTTTRLPETTTMSNNNNNNQYHGITSEETRRLAGLVAKTRALFETSKNNVSSGGENRSRCSINKSISAYSLSSSKNNKANSSNSNKENNYSTSHVSSSGYQQQPQPQPQSQQSATNVICDRYIPLSSSFHSNLSSLSYKQFKSSGVITTTTNNVENPHHHHHRHQSSSNESCNKLWSKTNDDDNNNDDEIVKELNLPRSVKEARMAFESLASKKNNTSSSSSNCSSSMSFSNGGGRGGGGSYSKLAQSTHFYPTDAGCTYTAAPNDYEHTIKKFNRKPYYDSPPPVPQASSTIKSSGSSSSSSNHHNLNHPLIVKPRSSSSYYRNNLVVDMTGSTAPLTASSSYNPTATAAAIATAAAQTATDSSSLSSNNSVDLNSHSPTESQSSCNTTPRSSSLHKLPVSNNTTITNAAAAATATTTPGSILNHIKRSDDLVVAHPNINNKLFGSCSLSSSASSTSSISCSSYTTENNKPSGGRFNKLFATTNTNSAVSNGNGGKINQGSGYRKLEDIMTEADNLTLNSILINEQRYANSSSDHHNGDGAVAQAVVDVTPDHDKRVVVKSILRKFSGAPSSSSSVAETAVSDNLVDKSSCVLPSKIKTTVATSQQFVAPAAASMATTTTPKTSNYSRFNGNVNVNSQQQQHNYRPWSSSSNTTPVRSTGAGGGGTFIKNSQSSVATTAATSSGGVVKRATRNAAAAREALVRWCSKVTEGYAHVNITNFSSSWADGMAFCALVHRFMPNEFDYAKLSPANREYNFTLAFTVAEEKAGVLALLDVEDMIEMGNSPDWKCVFTYVHTLYQRFKEEY